MAGTIMVRRKTSGVRRRRRPASTPPRHAAGLPITTITKPASKSSTAAASAG